jgi:hypothetical protein
MIKEALFSEDRKERYWLFRQWDKLKPLALVVLKNPSEHSTEKEDSKTMASLIRLIKFNGYGGFYVMNIYPVVSTKLVFAPSVLEDNLNQMREIAEKCKDIIVGWGNSVRVDDARKVSEFLWGLKHRLYCFGYNQFFTPKHPLYVRGQTKIQIFTY